MMKIILTIHEFRDGPTQALLKYLNEKKDSTVVYIANKYLIEDDARTIKTVYNKGIKSSEVSSKNYHYLPSIARYIKDIIFTFYYALMSEGTWDLYVGGDGSLTMPGIILKKLGKVKKLIFYTIDFSDNRFNNKLLNMVYILFDRLGTHFADEVWNVSPAIQKARKHHYEVHDRMRKKQKTVPLGAWVQRIPNIPYDKCLKHTVVFMGHILEKQGLQLVINSIPTIIKKEPKFKLRIIGDGPYLPNLKKLAKDLKVSKYIEFLGHVKSHKKLEILISECVLAVALYDPKIADFTYYADPGKIKNYLAASVPVLLTDVPKIAKEVAKRNAGYIVEYSEKSFSSIVLKLLKNPSILNTMRLNALSLGKEYDWNNIFKKAGL